MIQRLEMFLGPFNDDELHPSTAPSSRFGSGAHQGHFLLGPASRSRHVVDVAVEQVGESHGQSHSRPQCWVVAAAASVGVEATVGGLIGGGRAC